MAKTWNNLNVHWQINKDVIYIHMYTLTHTHTHTHTHNWILLSHKKGWGSAICSCMDGPRAIILNEVRERQISYNITYMWNQKWYKWAYLKNRNRFTDCFIENRLVVSNEKWGMLDWEFGTGRCKLLYVEWVNNRELSSISDNHNGKEYV